MAEELGEGDSLVGDNNIEPPSPHGAVDGSTSVPPPLPDHDEEEAKKAARAKQMRGLTKRKSRKFCRVVRSTKHQKNIDFDYSNYNSNAQQARAAIAPAKTRSPISKVKRDRARLTAQLDKSYKSNLRLEEKVEKQATTINDLNTQIKALNQALHRERKASNIIIDKAMEDAHRLSAEAMDMMDMAQEKYDTAEDKIIAEKDRAASRVRKERAIHVRQLEKRDQEYEASINLIKVAHDKKNLSY